MNDRRGVALVDDALEWDIAKPACSTRLVVHPFPIVVIVPIRLTVRLRDLAAIGGNGVMQSTPMRPSRWPIEPCQLIRDPLGVSMIGVGIEPIRIVLGRQYR